MTEQMTDADVVAGEDRVERAAWLVPGVLVAVVSLDRTTVNHRHLRLLAERDGARVELKSRWLVCDQGTPERVPSRWLVTASSQMAAEDLERSVLVLEDRDGTARLADEPLEAQVQGIVEFVQEGLAGLDAKTRARVIAFLNAAPAAQGITPGPELSARLATVRDMVREPLAVTATEPDAGPAVRLESGLPIDHPAHLRCGS